MVDGRNYVKEMETLGWDYENTGGGCYVAYKMMTMKSGVVKEISINSELIGINMNSREEYSDECDCSEMIAEWGYDEGKSSLDKNLGEYLTVDQIAECYQIYSLCSLEQWGVDAEAEKESPEERLIKTMKHVGIKDFRKLAMDEAMKMLDEMAEGGEYDEKYDLQITFGDLNLRLGMNADLHDELTTFLDEVIKRMKEEGEFDSEAVELPDDLDEYIENNIEVTYVETLDRTIIFDYGNKESGELVGFYYGTPNKALTKTFIEKK